MIVLARTRDELVAHLVYANTADAQTIRDALKAGEESPQWTMAEQLLSFVAEQSRLWQLDVRVHGSVRCVEEFGVTIDEAREIASTRYGVPLVDVASVVGPDGECISRPEVRS